MIEILDGYHSVQLIFVLFFPYLKCSFRLVKLVGHGASGNTQVAHWDSMLNAQGDTITRWHALLES